MSIALLLCNLPALVSRNVGMPGLSFAFLKLVFNIRNLSLKINYSFVCTVPFCQVGGDYYLLVSTFVVQKCSDQSMRVCSCVLEG